MILSEVSLEDDAMSIKISKLYTGLLAIICCFFLAFHTVVTPDSDVSFQSIKPVVREMQEFELINFQSEYIVIPAKDRKGVKVSRPRI